jgi:L-rhamnonate dehydratase
MSRVTSVRAFVSQGGGADYHDQETDRWIDGKVSTPMSVYPEYRAYRSSWGLNVLGSVIVEVEDDQGNVGVGVSTGGVPAAWLIENHLARFVEGAPVGEVERVWDQMWRATTFYGRKGLAVFAISAVDLAMWDLWGVARGEPVHELLGGAIRHELEFYATGNNPSASKRLGFAGAKTTMTRSPAEGLWALDAELQELATIREAVGADFPLMLDCWMSLTLPTARRLLHGLAELGYVWVEEAVPPEDYREYAEFRRNRPAGTMVTTGEHEAGAQAFRTLPELRGADIIQPDVGRCGGMTELRRIAALADSYGVAVPHGSSVYSYHFLATHRTPHPEESLMMHPDASEVVPMFAPLVDGEPVPKDGKLRIDDRPGFGVSINEQVPLHRRFGDRTTGVPGSP